MHAQVAPIAFWPCVTHGQKAMGAKATMAPNGHQASVPAYFDCPAKAGLGRLAWFDCSAQPGRLPGWGLLCS